LCQNDESHYSVKENVSKRRVVPTAPPLTVQTICSADTHHPTRTKMRNDITNGPTRTVPSFPLRFRKDSPRRCLGGIEPYQNKLIRRSVRKNISKRWTVPWALSPYLQATSLPVTQGPTRIRHSYGPKMAIASTNPRCPQSSRHRRLEVLRHRRHDAVRVKHSNSNAISKAKSNTLLAFVMDPSKHAYSPGIVAPHSPVMFMLVWPLLLLRFLLALFLGSLSSSSFDVGRLGRVLGLWLSSSVFA
jgi:hypothetical protein